MKSLSGLHLSGTLVISWRDSSPAAKFFSGRKMVLWSGTDFCYNFHSGLLVEAGNGIDDRQLLLKLLGQQAHILEDTADILLAGVKLVEQMFEKALFRNGNVAADCRRNLLWRPAKPAAIFCDIKWR